MKTEAEIIAGYVKAGAQPITRKVQLLPGPPTRVFIDGAELKGVLGFHGDEPSHVMPNYNVTIEFRAEAVEVITDLSEVSAAQ